MSIRARTTGLIALCLTLFTLAACGGDSTRPPSKGTIVVRNQSSKSIVDVNISTCSDAIWGADRLGANETIEPGAEHSFTVEPGCYDTRAVASGGTSVKWYDKEVAAGETRTLVAAESMSASRAGGPLKAD